jgi:hypothetical protein
VVELFDVFLNHPVAADPRFPGAKLGLGGERREKIHTRRKCYSSFNWVIIRSRPLKIQEEGSDMMNLVHVLN